MHSKMKQTIKIFMLLVMVILLILGGCSTQNTQQLTGSATNEAPEATFTTVEGKEVKLSEYRGEKVMFWFFATWCPSCIKAAQVLEEKNNQLNGMKIIALKTYGNAGYRGESVEQFAQKNAPQTFNYNNWIWGDASQEATQIYNSKNYPDIYYLIDENGIVRDVDGAPAATLNKIIQFAQG